MGVTGLRRLCQLEEEDTRLKQVVADLTLDKHVLSEALQGEVRGPRAVANWPAGLRRGLRGRSGIVLGVLFLVTLPFLMPVLRGDGVGYYAWLVSPAIDGDLQFANEFAHGNTLFKADWFHTDGSVKQGITTATGHIPNQWSTGAAVLWAPFFATGHLVTDLLGSAGPPGFTAPELLATAFGTALMAFLSLYIGFRFGRDRFGASPAMIGTIAVWLGSSLPIYYYFLAFVPYAIAGFGGAVLLLVWYRSAGWSWHRWGVLGILTGFITAIYPVAGTWSFLPIAGICTLDNGSRRERLLAFVPFTLGMVVGYLPQAVLKGLVYGNPLTTGYTATWNFVTPAVFNELFSANHGLIFWTPITGAAIVGLFILARRDHRLGSGLLVVFSAMVYMAAAYTTDEQSSYGNRFFVVFTPGFVIGTIAFVGRTWECRNQLLRFGVVTLLALLVVWNGLFMFQWAWGLVPKRGPVDWSTMAAQQVSTAPSELSRVLKLFLNDRGKLLRLVEERDLRNFDAGDR